MTLDDLTETVETSYSAFDDSLDVALDRETKNELSLLEAALEPDNTDELVRRAIHMLFQTSVDTGSMDFHLRRGFDVTYDEYLSGMTFDEMTGGYDTHDSDPRRYQF